MKRLLLAFLLLAATGLFLYACSGDDSVVSNNDGGSESDASFTDGSFGNDGSTSDGSTGDAGDDAALNATSLQIQAVKDQDTPDAAAGDGGLAVNLPIDHAIVTYVRPVVGADPAGFFLQAQKTGPAIFVAIDPSSLTPQPVPGDDVSMTVTNVANVASLHEITAVTGFTRNSQGNSITALLRDVSTATDLVSKLNNYESEYIQIAGFVATAFGGSSAGSVSAQITTMGFSSPTSSLKIRLPVTVQAALDPEPTCSFTLTGVMWRFLNGAEPSGFVNGDLSVTCGNPQVASAVAASLTTVNVVFDRNIAPSSVMSNGSQFTIVDGVDAGPGLNVSAATMLDARTVQLTTDTQNQGQAYTVTAGASITDVLSKPIDAAHDSANFVGFLVPALVRLNELNPMITGSKDLVELQVLSDGDLIGMSLVENLISGSRTLAVLPRLHVVTGDLVIIHLNADLADGGAGSVTNETTTKSDCTDLNCRATAWDVKDTSVPPSKNGLTDGARVVVIARPDGSIMDAISWYDASQSVSASFVDETNALIDAGMWSGCGGFCADRDAAIDISVNMHSTSSQSDGGINGRSEQRITPIGVNTHSMADWAIDAGNFGLDNN